MLDFDPLNQVATRELCAEHWRDGELIGREEGSLSINIYFKSEVVLMLQAPGPCWASSPAPDERRGRAT